MAELVRLKYSPEKWVYKRALVGGKTSYVRPADIENLRQKNHELDTRAHVVRDLIANFIAQKPSIFQSAYQRSFRNYQARLVMETLVFAANWFRANNQEMNAIKTIANAICCGIVGDKKAYFDGGNFDELINEKLSNCMFICMYLHTDVFEGIKCKYSDLLTIFNRSDFYRRCEYDSGARLEIGIVGELLHLDFDHKDADKILAAVMRDLASIPNLSD